MCPQEIPHHPKAGWAQNCWRGTSADERNYTEEMATSAEKKDFASNEADVEFRLQSCRVSYSTLITLLDVVDAIRCCWRCWQASEIELYLPSNIH